MSPSPRGRLAGRLGPAWRFVRGVSRGLSMGAFFPPDGRSPGSPAPGGSEVFPHPAAQAGRDGTAAFVRSTHRLPLPGLTSAVRVLHLSDVHLRGPSAWLDPLCAAVAAEHADLVVLTGDLVTRGWQEATVRRFLDALPAAPLGRLAILGNWEHWSDVRPGPWRALLAEHGVELLVEEVREVGPLRIAGSDDLLAGAPDLPGLRARLRRDRPNVVLAHSPACFPALAGPPVDLVLSGHSHGGQVRVPGLGALWVPRGSGPYVAGWYERDGSHLFVHQGVGWSIAPLRLGCPPELAHLLLLPA